MKSLVLILGSAIAFILLVTVTETCLWWYLWHQDTYKQKPHPKTWKNALVFVTGISDYTQQDLCPEQIQLIQGMNQKFDFETVLTEPFPWNSKIYSKIAQFEIWHFLGFSQLPLFIISLHNFWQTLLILAFPKLYGAGIARCLINRIGLPENEESQLIFVCGSTGVGMVLSSLLHLTQIFKGKITIISYGGVFSSMSGLDHVHQFFHLLGTRDFWAKLGESLLLTGQFRTQHLIKAKQEQRFFTVEIGEHRHLEYLSDRFSQPDNQTYFNQTLNAILNLPILKSKSHL